MFHNISHLLVGSSKYSEGKYTHGFTLMKEFMCFKSLFIFELLVANITCKFEMLYNFNFLIFMILQFYFPEKFKRFLS